MKLKDELSRRQAQQDTKNKSFQRAASANRGEEESKSKSVMAMDSSHNNSFSTSTLRQNKSQKDL